MSDGRTLHGNSPPIELKKRRFDDVLLRSCFLSVGEWLRNLNGGCDRVVGIHPFFKDMKNMRILKKTYKFVWIPIAFYGCLKKSWAPKLAFYEYP